MQRFDAIILGAGAAGLMCGIEAARRGRRVAVMDHATKPAEKIRISGGGKCNFTNLDTSPKNFLSQNPNFCISALKRFTPHDFLHRIQKARIPYFEKTEGQLFCETSAHDIIDMLLDDLRDAGAELWLNTTISDVRAVEAGFELTMPGGLVACDQLVIATGGLSIPKMGATGFAYEIARQFGHDIVQTQAGLVPFALGDDKLAQLAGLPGVSLTARVSVNGTSFTDGFLFTHRGLSGPAVLQASSYWRVGNPVEIDLLPDFDVLAWLRDKRDNRGKQSLGVALCEILPKRLVERWLENNNLRYESKIGELSNASLTSLSNAIKKWTFVPMGTEGYRTAEVTLGGIDTRQLSSQTLESALQPGLYFIGECVDVTGWLGGYNFQWAWSSGWACGQAL